MYIVVAVIFVVLGFFFWASYSISGGVYLKSLCRNRKAGKVIALTFDDGVDETLTPKVLDVLRKYEIKAAFFVIGQKAERFPEIVRRIVAEGHTLGNHTYAHEAGFPMKSGGAMVRELKKAEIAIETASGKAIKLFRPPFGVTNPMVGYAVRRMKYTSIGWSIRSLDTLKKPREWVLRRVENRLHDGAVILLHDNRKHSPELLEEIIKSAMDKGYKVVSIDELFDIKNK